MLKKFKKNGLVNKKYLQYIINTSNLCQHALKELKIAGYYNANEGPDKWMREQVMESIALFSSHGNSGFSAPCEINLVKKLSSFDIISPLTLNDEEFMEISDDGTMQNKRKYCIFKDPNGRISNVDAFTSQVVQKKKLSSSEVVTVEKPMCWSSRVYVCDKGIATGEHFHTCYIKEKDVNEHKYMPPEKIKIPCIEVELENENYVFFVEKESSELKKLSELYDINYKFEESLKGKSIFELKNSDLQ